MRKFVLMALALAFVFSSCKGVKAVRGVTEEKSPQKVEVIYVRAQENVSVDSYVGQVKVSKKVTLSAKYPGTVVSIEVSEGSVLKEGDVLARLSSSTVESTFESAVATFAYAKDGLERAEKVYRDGVIPEQKIVSVRADFQKAKAAYEAALAAKEDLVVKAPFDGVVEKISVVENESVAPLAPIATLLDNKNLEIEISVPEKEIAALKVGTRMYFTVTALEDGAVYEAEVTSKAVTSSLLTHTYSCTLSPVKVPQGLFPGMICSVRRNSAAALVVIPATIIRTDASGRYVWSVVDGIVRKQYIEIGGYKGDGVVVREGLQEGDAVICSGCQKFSEGEKVLVDGTQN